jgi:lipopolysaccharide export LptBFGC system permease protein LptF
MKRYSVAMATAIGLSCFSLWSCNSQDPSAARENEKALAEAMTKVAKLEQEIASLKTENETLIQKASSSETKAESGMTAAQLDAKLKATVTTLSEQLAAMEKKIDHVGSQTEKVIAQNETRAKESQAVVQRDPAPQPAPPERTVEREPARPQPPAAPAKPKQKYDITLDNPVMGPGSR